MSVFLGTLPLFGHNSLGLLQNDRRLQALDKRINSLDKRINSVAGGAWKPASTPSTANSA